MNGPTQTTALADLQAIRAFAVLTLDGRKWLLPQAEVQALESLLDIDREVKIPGSIGAVAFAGEWWPVYCLSGELQVLSHLPDGRRACPLLDNGADRFGLVCDQVETLAAAPRPQPLPACMTLPDSPIQALVLLNDGLGCVTTTEHLAALIAAAPEKADG
ncbi:MAG: hypothetical protein P9F19_06660 [Candidatus Contendobacter sp.]|nr:hypothetical protein [Candidatus Contendobacter sp.]MDG4557052.1 hypothetical protein [Candidatus Contendobacter sp.]